MFKRFLSLPFSSSLQQRLHHRLDVQLLQVRVALARAHKDDGLAGRVCHGDGGSDLSKNRSRKVMSEMRSVRCAGGSKTKDVEKMRKRKRKRTQPCSSSCCCTPSNLVVDGVKLGEHNAVYQARLLRLGVVCQSLQF